MITTKLIFDPTGWLEIEYIQADGDTPLTLQSTSYHPTQLELIHADCATHGVTIEGDDAQAVAQWVADYIQPPPVAPTLEDFDRALTAHLDSTAQQKRYDNRITCMVRAGFPGPFQSEGIAFATWCDRQNALAYQLLSDVQSGKRQMPSSPAEFIGMLPAMVWPT